MKQDKLEPNPKRRVIRQRLADVRRRGRAAKLSFKKTGKQTSLEEYKNLRRHERALSRRLVKCAPIVNARNEPFYPTGHFKRFRHSTRFGKFERVWSEITKRIFWRRKCPTT